MVEAQGGELALRTASTHSRATSAVTTSPDGRTALPRNTATWATPTTRSRAAHTAAVRSGGLITRTCITRDHLPVRPVKAIAPRPAVSTRPVREDVAGRPEPVGLAVGEDGAMRAAQVTALDGPSAVRPVEIDEPAAGDRVLIDVHAAGVSFPEVLQTRGLYQIKPDLPFVPGSEVAGVVRAAPAGAAVGPGDRVAAFPGLGGFAEVVAVDPGMVFPLPDAVSFAAGAALPMNYLTVHFALVRRGALQRARRCSCTVPRGASARRPCSSPPPSARGSSPSCRRRTRPRWRGPPGRTRPCRPTGSSPA